MSDRCYGWIPQAPDPRDREFLRVMAPMELPSSIDLTDEMPPVYDQGQLGSCTGNAISAAVDYQIGREGKPFINPSRLFVYWNERNLEGTVDQDSGAQIRDGIKVVNTFGVCPESEWAYDTSQFATRPPDSCYTDALKDRAVSYEAVAQDPDLTALRSALAQKLPVVIGFSVYSSFESPEVARSGFAPMPAPGETLMGGHAVLAVGYVDATRKVKIRNSWGPGWGLNGYFYLPYEYLASPDLSSDWWAIEVVGA